eukprot:COSAG02_NODE_2634_length_8374_cov_12.795166_8_plen_72_part_00
MTQNSNRNHRIGPAGTLARGPESLNQPFTHQLGSMPRERGAEQQQLYLDGAVGVGVGVELCPLGESNGADG